MRVRAMRLGLVGVLAATMGCAASGNDSSSTEGGAGGTGGNAGTTSGASGSGAGGNVGGSAGSGLGGQSGQSGQGGQSGQSGQGGQGGFEACTKFTAEAEQAPAAMLFAVDMSASMKLFNKWATAQTSIVAAMDKDVFDSTSLGLVTFPTDFTEPPPCVCDYIESQAGPGTCNMYIPNGVSCGFSGLPQIAIAPANQDKSNAASGVRHDIYQYLVNHSPQSNDDDGSPVYDAMVSGYNALKGQNIDRRILVLITDGGFSCTSVSARDGYVDAFGCHDWEYPDSVNQLITQARTDAAKPIFTFVIGVPGSDSFGEKQGNFDTAPYHMKLALSSYAVSGSPDTIDPACSKDIPFTQNGFDPPVPCHIDLSGGAAFNPDALATAIQTIRGKALGCVYALPSAPPGETIDPNFVNVDVTLDDVLALLKKRSDPNDTCATDGCWDYNTQGQVEILGKTCDDIAKATKAKVDIKVGCSTVLQ